MFKTNLFCVSLLLVFQGCSNHEPVAISLENRKIFKFENGSIGVLFSDEFKPYLFDEPILNIRSFIAKDSFPGWVPTDEEITRAYNSVRIALDKKKIDASVYNYQFLSYMDRDRKLIHVIATTFISGIEFAPSSCDDCTTELLIFTCEVEDKKSHYEVYFGTKTN